MLTTPICLISYEIEKKTKLKYCKLKKKKIDLLKNEF